MEEKIRVLFVCTGNICRSPTAEAVFRKLVQSRGLSERIEALSAGTQAYHVGEGADHRSSQHAKRRGHDLSAHQARKFKNSDLEEFDWILCMDRSHLEAVQEAQYPGSHAHVELFLRFATDSSTLEMPDPYYGGDQGFDHVLDLCEDASVGLLEEILRSSLEESSRRG